MVIHPDVIVTPDTPTVRFNQPREQIDLDKEITRILHAQGWGCGTYFNVQFLNHEKTKLLGCGRFVVTDETETVQTNDANPYQTMTKTVFSRRAEQIGEWWPQLAKATLDHEAGLSVKAKGEVIVNGSSVYAGHQETDPPLMEEVTRAVEGTSQEYRAAIAEEPKRRGRPPKAA